jgi:hypothetical protein
MIRPDFSSPPGRPERRYVKLGITTVVFGLATVVLVFVRR